MPRKPSIDSLRMMLQRLTLEQKQEIYAWLGESIVANVEGAIEVPERSRSATIEQRHYEGRTYQLEKRRCNKARCRCMAGAVAEVGHGPYWYAYWKDQKKSAANMSASVHLGRQVVIKASSVLKIRSQQYQGDRSPPIALRLLSELQLNL